MSAAALHFKLATTRAEREAAFRLVHDNYVRSGLAQPHPQGLRVTPHHLLDATSVFVGKLEDTVVSTVTLVMDASLGLPLEAMYGNVVARKRAAGLALAEVTCLADRRREMSRFLNAFLPMTRLLAQFARSQGVDELLAAVHPRHAPFYRRYLGFEEIAGLANCPHVCDNPALGLALSFARCDVARPDCYDMYFSRPLTPDQLAASPMSAEEIDDFGKICRRAELEAHREIIGASART